MSSMYWVSERGRAEAASGEEEILSLDVILSFAKMHRLVVAGIMFVGG